MTNDKVAIITGAGRGIGQATAIALGRRGYRLALAARSLDQLDETRSLVTTDAIAVPTDVTDPAAAEALVRRTMEIFGRVDVLVNNAGVAPVLAVEEMSPAQWREIIETNLSSAFYLTRPVWPIMKARGGGVIVNVSSAASRDPFLGFSAYGAAKAGLNLFTSALAREGAGHGIRVHAVAPGAVETAMFRKLMTPAQWPAERTLLPENVADVIVACVMGELRYSSGEVIFMSR